MGREGVWGKSVRDREEWWRKENDEERIWNGEERIRIKTTDKKV